MTTYTRRPRTGIMLAYPLEAKRFAKWATPWLVQPKYNGERCMAVRGSDYVELYSSTGLLINTVPHVVEAVHNLPIGIYDGELYIHENFQRLTSLVGRSSPVAGCREVKYVIFDMKSPHTQKKRLMNLAMVKERVNPAVIELAPTWFCSTEEELQEILAEQMALNYEGVIVREANATYVEKRATTMMKLKPRSSDTYRIVDFTEEISIQGNPKGRLGAFRVIDADGRQFKVGSGFTHEQRSLYWQQKEQLRGRLVYVKYQALTDRGVPWFSVFIEVVRA